MGICLIVKSGGGVDTSNATATTDKILSGYTVYSNDNKITGTIGNVGNQNTTDTTWGSAGRTKYWGWPGGTIYIWEGWHDGTSGVDAWSLASQTGGCDIPGTDSCLKGYSYWNDGVKYNGTMPALGKQTWTIGVNGSQTIGWGWHDGTGTVKQSISVDSGEYWITPSTSQQQLCWSGWYYSKNRWCNGNGNLVAGNIKKGVSIFGVTGTWATSRRLIVENGSSTGLCTLTSHSGSDTKSWGGSTWKLLCDTSWSYIDSDEGSQTMSYWLMGITAFNDMFTRENKSEYAAKFGFTIGMDVLMCAYNGSGSSYTVSPQVYTKYITRKGNSSKWPRYVRFTMSTYSIANDTWTAGSISATGAGGTGNTSDGISGAAVGTMWFDYSGGPGTYQHARNGVYVWVKNLWFDLSGSLSYGY